MYLSGAQQMFGMMDQLNKVEMQWQNGRTMTANQQRAPMTGITETGYQACTKACSQSSPPPSCGCLGTLWCVH